MNPSNLPPQGRYTDDRLQQMVLDELNRNGVTPEKFYFTSDDWMVTYDGQTPAWNSVFGIAAYHQDGQAQYAECGVSQRYDAATTQWGDPAANVKVGLPLSEEAFAAAPSAIGGGQPAAGQDASGSAPGQDASGQDAPGQDEAASMPHSEPESSQTVLAGAIPGLPGDTNTDAAPDAAADQAVTGDAGAVDSGDDEPQSTVPSGEEWSAAERADGQPRVEPGPGEEWHHTDREPEPEREPVPSGDEWSSAEPAAGAAAAGATAAGATAAGATVAAAGSSDLRQAGDLGVDESAPETPSYEAAGAESEARAHPDGGHHAHVAGYALRVKEDGTAELQVPLGGQVTLRWAGEQS